VITTNVTIHYTTTTAAACAAAAAAATTTATAAAAACTTTATATAMACYEVKRIDCCCRGRRKFSIAAVNARCTCTAGSGLIRRHTGITGGACAAVKFWGHPIIWGNWDWNWSRAETDKCLDRATSATRRAYAAGAIGTGVYAFGTTGASYASRITVSKSACLAAAYGIAAKRTASTGRTGKTCCAGQTVRTLQGHAVTAAALTAETACTTIATGSAAAAHAAGATGSAATACATTATCRTGREALCANV
jgi:hypothetical protein